MMASLEYMGERHAYKPPSTITTTRRVQPMTPDDLEVYSISKRIESIAQTNQDQGKAHDDSTFYYYLPSPSRIHGLTA
jgi:hypothetical protein